MRRDLLSKLLLSIAVSALLTLALLGARASANSPSASVSFAGNATLIGTTVDVPVHYSCAPPNPGQLEVVLDENGVESTNFVMANCDGQKHSITVPITGPFTPGAATAQAAVSNLDASSEAVNFGSNITIK